MLLVPRLNQWEYHRDTVWQSTYGSCINMTRSLKLIQKGTNKENAISNSISQLVDHLIFENCNYTFLSTFLQKSPQMESLGPLHPPEVEKKFSNHSIFKLTRHMIGLPRCFFHFIFNVSPKIRVSFPSLYARGTRCGTF